MRPDVVNVMSTYGPLGAETLAAIRAADPTGVFRYEPRQGRIEPTKALDEDVEVAFMNGLPTTLERTPRLRWVQIASAGADTYTASPAWTDDSIVITTASGIASASIAEYALAMILVHGHRLDTAMAVKSARRWPERDEEFDELVARPATRQTLGIIGFGGVGRRLAWLGRAAGMEVVAIRAHAGPPRPSFRPGAIEFLDERAAGVTLVAPDRLDDVLSVADHIVVAVPRTPTTTGMLGARELALMKPTSHLVNVARGGIVDEEALAAALRTGRPAFATLDVTASEPPAPSSPLYDLPNVRMTPHIAGFFAGYEDAAAGVFAENLRRYVASEPLLNRVDRVAGY